MNKKQSRQARAIRKGHLHSPPVMKAEIVALNKQQSLSSVVQSSGVLQGSIHLAKAKSPTHGAYAPIHGQGQGPIKQRVTPADKRPFYGAVPTDEKAGVIPPERKYRQANTKRGKIRHGFRKFNATGKA